MLNPLHDYLKVHHKYYATKENGMK